MPRFVSHYQPVICINNIVIKYKKEKATNTTITNLQAVINQLNREISILKIENIDSELSQQGPVLYS